VSTLPQNPLLFADDPKDHTAFAKVVRHEADLVYVETLRHREDDALTTFE
jgi:hypothetical protein